MRFLGSLRLSLVDGRYRDSQWQRLKRAVARDGAWRVLVRALRG